MNLQVIDIKGKKTSTVNAADSLFTDKINEGLLAQYLRVFSLRSRSANARVQTRAVVTGTTAKVWRQKGTGRARHGSRKAPIFVGGGQAHGPIGNQNYKLGTSKKLRKQAMIQALSVQKDNLIVIEGLEKVSGKTTELAKIMGSAFKDIKKVIFVLENSQSKIIQAATNLDTVSTTQAHRLNPFEIMNNNRIVFTKEALNTLTARFTTTPKKADSKTTKTKEKNS